MLSELLQVWEAEDFLDAHIKSAINHVDELIIIEGKHQPGKDRRSSDGTLEIIDRWRHHPKIKIKCVEDDNIDTQMKCKNLFFDMTHTKPGDYLLLAGFDEFYSKEDWEEIEKIVSSDNDQSWKFNQRVFINDFTHYMKMCMPRLFKIRDGYQFLELGDETFDKDGNLIKCLIHPTINMFHYSYLTSQRYFLKKVHQRIHQEKLGFPWFLEKGRIVRPGREILEYKGQHPLIIEEKYIQQNRNPLLLV